MKITGFVESISELASNGNQRPLICIMLEGLPILAQANQNLDGVVDGSEVTLGVRVTSKKEKVNGSDKTLRTFWLSGIASAVPA